MTLKTVLLGAVAAAAITPAAFAERGSDGQVSIIYWQAPSIMNPFLSGGTKDLEAASLVIEPLARYNEVGELVPWLVDEVPTLANGGISEDQTTITWKISEGLTWSDGTAFTSADVLFTYEYCTDEESGCSQLTKFEGVSSVEAPDDLTVVITFEGATPNPYGPFVGVESPIIQAAQFADCMGAAAPSCTEANFNPVGTGPFVVTDFRPNDVIQFAANENYRDPMKPAFATVLFKGGGSAEASGRAVMETGEFDYGWNLQLAPDVIAKMEEGGMGVPVAGFGTGVERIMLNWTDASPDLPEGERATAMHPHPFLREPAVYQAMSMAIDRALLAEIGYGNAGKPTCNWVASPEAYNSTSLTCDVQDIAGANALLDEAGIVDTDGDGVREKDGVPLAVLFQTSTNAVRQDYQAIIKDWWSQIGIEAELRAVDASVFFGGDPGSPDTFQRFYADVQMYQNTFSGTDPQTYLGNALCDKAPRPETQWQGENISRFCMPEYDALWATLAELKDPAERAEIAKALNDMAVSNGQMIPLTHRGRISAHATSLGGVVLNTFDSELWNIADWTRIDG